MTSSAGATNPGRLMNSVALTTLLCAATLLACERTSTAGTAPNQPPPPTLTSAAEPGAAAVSAYRRYWQVVERMGHAGRWRDPLLAQVATGDAAAAISRTVYAWQRAHRTTRGHVTLHPSVVSATASMVVLHDCLDSRGWVLWSPAGPIARRSSGRDFAQVTLRAAPDGRWRVATVRFDLDRPC